MNLRSRRHLRSCFALFAVSAALVACDKKDSASAEEGESGPSAETLLAECTDLSAKIENEEIDFQEGMSKMMARCGEACDAGADDACAEAKRGVDALCNVVPSACTDMCGSMDSQTLNDLTCNFEPEPDTAPDPAGASAGAGATGGAPPAGAADEVDAPVRCAEIKAQLEAKEVKFTDVMSEFMSICSVACDEGDKDACGEAASAISVLCEVKPDVCKELCGTMQSDTANQFLCNPPQAPE